MENLNSQAIKFDLPANIHYLNGAYMSPQLKSVTQVGMENIIKKARPYEITIDDFFGNTDKIRSEYSKLINNNDPKRVVLIPSVSYGMANVTRNLQLKGREVVVAGEQFPSNVYPWMNATREQGGKLLIVDAPKTINGRGEQWNNNILQAINNDTALVALSHTHWADGTLFDLLAIRKRTREVGALLIIDGTQSVGALPFDISVIDPDALICAGYKWLLGPYGIGLAYYGKFFDQAKPVEENWINRLHSENFAGLVNYENAYQTGALRFEVGEHSNFILVPMLLAALRQINEWKPARIQAYCEQITASSIANLKAAGFWVEDSQWRANHLFGIRHSELNVDEIRASLADRNIFVSIRGNAIRVSPYVHNSAENMKALTDVLLENIKAHV